MCESGVQHCRGSDDGNDAVPPTLQQPVTPTSHRYQTSDPFPCQGSNLQGSGDPHSGFAAYDYVSCLLWKKMDGSFEISHFFWGGEGNKQIAAK